MTKEGETGDGSDRSDDSDEGDVKNTSASHNPNYIEFFFLKQIGRDEWIAGMGRMIIVRI